ncbi:hypothetical protein FQR65_LT12956 [Abscondita terminalis]|nr:hypothetical protein FQR65_LT12956 [Abscondita terminalis]
MFHQEKNIWFQRDEAPAPHQAVRRPQDDANASARHSIRALYRQNAQEDYESTVQHLRKPHLRKLVEEPTAPTQRRSVAQEKMQLLQKPWLSTNAKNTHTDLAIDLQFADRLLRFLDTRSRQNPDGEYATDDKDDYSFGKQYHTSAS